MTSRFVVAGDVPGVGVPGEAVAEMASDTGPFNAMLPLFWRVSVANIVLPAAKVPAGVVIAGTRSIPAAASGNGAGRDAICRE